MIEEIEDVEFNLENYMIYLNDIDYFIKKIS